jgi:hypothetical protein
MVKERGMRHMIVVVALIAAGTALAQPKILDVSSTVAGEYSWGSTWTPFQWYRYAQCGLSTRYTRSLASPTYLNAILVCSQTGGTSQYTAYISTGDMLPVPMDSWVYYDGNWRVWKVLSGGTQVGMASAGDDPVVVSWNVDSWIQSHPSQTYFVAFDQMADGWDACVHQVWLGPEGEVDLLEQPVPAPRNPGVSATALPNPSDGATLIRFALPKGERVSVRVYDAQGAVVRTLLADTQQSAGAHCLSWDGRDDTGSRVVPATYYYRVNAASQVVKGKIVLHG